MQGAYAVMTKALVLLKAAGLRIPAVTRGEKLRLLDVWVQRYGAVEGAVFLAAVRRVAAGRYFPRFCDLDAALAEEQQLRKGQIAETRQKAVPVDREGNQRRVRELIERLAQRDRQL